MRAVVVAPYRRESAWTIALLLTDGGALMTVAGPSTLHVITCCGGALIGVVPGKPIRRFHMSTLEQRQDVIVESDRWTAVRILRATLLLAVPSLALVLTVAPVGAALAGLAIGFGLNSLAGLRGVISGEQRLGKRVARDVNAKPIQYYLIDGPRRLH